MLFLAGLNFNNLTGSVTPLCAALVSCLVKGQVQGLDLVLSRGQGETGECLLGESEREEVR